MSGAGRSTAANVLEDLGWFVVDNLPPALLPTLAELGGRSQGDVARIAAVVDVRSRAFFADLTRRRSRSSPTDGSDPRIVFLEASDDVLVRRHEAVRRPHPLQGDGRLLDGIAREREMLRDLRGDADIVIDTTDLNVHELGAKVLPAFEQDDAPALHATVMSLRLQVRPAGRRRPGGRLPLPAQPALGARAAPADRARRRGARLRAGASRARRSSSTRYERAARDRRRRLPARGQALRDHRDRLHRRQAPQRRHGRGDRRAAARRTASTRRSCTATWGASDGDGSATSASRRASGGRGAGRRPRARRSLAALRRVTDGLTAVVTVADDGGSCGRLRRELGVLPPGDLRMALAALCGDDEWGRTWSDVVQHRFRSEGELHEPRGRQPADRRAVGAARRLRRRAGLGGPAARRAGPGAADVASCRSTSRPTSSSGPATGALTHGARPGRGRDDAPARSSASRCCPQTRRPAPRRSTAVRAADWVVLGPGSWFTSVLPHLLVPELRRGAARPRAPAAAWCSTSRRSPGRPTGFTPETHLEVLAAHAPDLRLDVVLADPATVTDRAALERRARGRSARERRARRRSRSATDHPDQHDPDRLAAAFDRLFAPDRLLE